MSSNEYIYNWTNTLQQSETGHKMVVAQMAHDLKQRNFSPSDALEIMAADGIDIKLAQSAIEGLWNDYRFASANSGGLLDNSGIDIGYEPKSQMVPVVPVEYADVAPIVEDQILRRISAREFITRLCRGEYPIVRVGTKDLNSLFDWAERAADDDTQLRQLHGILAPFFEDTMLNNVTAAQDINADYKIANRQGARCIVASKYRDSPQTECCLETGLCSCDRFIKGHYADFGMACEHLIYAADTINPMEQLMRPFAA